MALGYDRWPLYGHQDIPMRWPTWNPMVGVDIGVGDLVKCIHVNDYPVLYDPLMGVFLGRTRMTGLSTENDGRAGSIVMKLDGETLVLYDGSWELRVVSRLRDAVG